MARYKGGIECDEHGHRARDTGAAKSGRPKAYGLRPTACGLRPMACGLWPMAYGLRPSAFGFINQNTQVLLSNFIGTPSIEKGPLYCEEVHKYYFMNHKSEADQLQQRNPKSRPIKHQLNQNKVTHLLPPQLLQAKTCSRFSGIFVTMKHEGKGAQSRSNKATHIHKAIKL